YGEQTTKPAIYSWTPEVGPGAFGFWPPSNQIVNICQTALFQNITAANLPLVYGVVVDQNEDVISQPMGDFAFELRRYGLQDGPLTVSLEGISDNIALTGDDQVFNLMMNEDETSSIPYELEGGTQSGDELVFLLSVSNDFVTWSDTIVKTFLGSGAAVYSNDGSDMSTFIYNDDWGLSTVEFVSAPSSVTDSPFGEYPNNSVNVLITEMVSIPSEAVQAELNFWTKFEIENNFDFVQVYALDGNQNVLSPLCGLYTNNGVEPFQPIDEPLYDGFQNDWVYESMDLTDYIGQDIHIQFALLADGGVTEDGFYFDDLQIGIYEEGDSVSSVQSVLMAEWIEVYPNPVQTDLAVKIASLEISDLNKTPVRFRMYNTLGITVLEQPLNQRITEISMSPLANGLYWYQIEHEGVWSQAKRLSVQR
ncbi:MAG: T9SS type A sorting domain-containing protein, partial [Bacteroidota bacterium]